MRENRYMIFNKFKSILNSHYKTIRNLAIILVIHSFLHLIIGLIYYNPVDFVLQLEAAKEIARGKLLYRDIGELVLSDNLSLPRPQYPPLYLYSLALFIKIIGVEVFTWQLAKFFLILFNLFDGILIYYLIMRLNQKFEHREKIALLAINWYLINPITLGIIFGGYHEGFMLFFILIAFILFEADYHKLSGFFFGLGLLIKPIVVIYMLPLIVWGVQWRDVKVFKILLISIIIFLLGSLPFLLIIPEVYLYDVFFVHAQRLDPSMALFNYFFTNFQSSLIPFILQLTIISLIIIIFIFWFYFYSKFEIVGLVLPIMSLFLIFNRILYPHYIAFIFPFFTLNFFSFSIQSSQNKFFRVASLLSGLILVFFGITGWSLLWVTYGYSTFKTNPLFSFMSLISILGLIIITLASFFIQYLDTKKNLLSYEI